MTEKEQIENCAKTIRESQQRIQTYQPPTELGKAFEELNKTMREWQLKRIPKEDIAKYKKEILNYAEQIGFNPNDFVDKLTDMVLRTQFYNHSEPRMVLMLCLV